MANPKSEKIFSILYEIGKRLNSTFDTNTILDYIVNLTIKKLEYHNCSLLLIEDSDLVLKAGYGYNKSKFQDFRIPLGKGVTGKVALTGNARIINNIPKCKYYIPIVKGNKSEIVVPIKSKNKILGAYSIESRQLNAFDQQDIKIMRSIADLAAIALENATLYQSYEKSIRRLTNLYHSGKILNSNVSADKLFDVLLEIGSQNLKNNRIAILLIKDGFLYNRAAKGYTIDKITNYRAKVGVGIAGQVAKQGVPILAGDVSKNKFYVGFTKHSKSELAVPIKYQDEILGVYNVECNQYNAYGEEDLLFLTALAEQAGIAIKNASFFNQIEEFNITLKRKVNEATQELILANEELKKLNNIKSEFVSTVSHELRTPLTSIKGYVSLVLEGHAGKISEQQKEFLSVANEESERLYRLINDLLDIQKIESKKMVYHFDECDLNDFFDKYSKEGEFECAKKDLYYRLLMPNDLPKIKLDEDKLKQIMTNLVSNAVKFTDSGGITVRVRNLKDFIQVSVYDTGIGMTKEGQKRLFQKFRQIDQDLTRKVGGTGLGLVITKNLVKAHKGSIVVKSKIGEGTKITFTISKHLNSD